MIIEETDIKNRYNLIDEDCIDEDRYIRQLDLDEVKQLGISIINLIKRD